MDRLYDYALSLSQSGNWTAEELAALDWDGDGDLDILADSANAEFYRNDGTIRGQVHLALQGNLAKRKVSGHSTSPTTIDLNGDGKRELLVGAEDGRFYYKKP